MTEVVIKYRLSSYSRWKAVEDKLALFSTKCGMLGNRVFLDPDNAQTVICVNRFRNAEGARDFLNSDEFQNSVKTGIGADVQYELVEKSS